MASERVVHLKCPSHRGKSEFAPGNLVVGEQPDLLSLVGGLDVGAQKNSPVQKLYLCDVREIMDSEQPLQ